LWGVSPHCGDTPGVFPTPIGVSPNVIVDYII